MARGSKSSYTNKQKRKASHIESGDKKRGVSTKEAERRAWATVNKQDGGAKKKKSTKSRSRTKAKSRRTPKRSTRSGAKRSRKSG